MSRFFAFLVLALTIVLTGSVVFAQEPTKGSSYYDFNTGANVRVGTYCRLTLEGDDVYDGLCTVSRRGLRTTIDIVRTKYFIERDDHEPMDAEFTTATGRSLGWVSAQGSCWVGRSVKYCAR